MRNIPYLLCISLCLLSCKKSETTEIYVNLQRTNYIDKNLGLTGDIIDTLFNDDEILQGWNRAPVLSENNLFVVDENSVLKAINLSSNTLLWKKKNRLDHFGTPSYSDGFLYLGYSNSSFMSLYAGSGSKNWSFETDSYVYGAPIVTDSLVYFGSDSGTFYAVDRFTGDERWSISTGGYIRGTATIEEQSIFFCSDSTLYHVDTKGTVIWKQLFDNKLTARCSKSGDNLYVSDEAGSLYSVTLSDGMIQWTFKSGSWGFESPSVDKQYVYLGTNDGVLRVIDKEKGVLAWSCEAGGTAQSPLVDRTTVFIYSFDGYLYNLDKTGKLLFKVKGTKFSQAPLYWKNSVIFEGENGALLQVK